MTFSIVLRGVAHALVRIRSVCAHARSVRARAHALVLIKSVCAHSCSTAFHIRKAWDRTRAHALAFLRCVCAHTRRTSMTGPNACARTQRRSSVIIARIFAEQHSACQQHVRARVHACALLRAGCAHTRSKAMRVSTACARMRARDRDYQARVCAYVQLRSFALC